MPTSGGEGVAGSRPVVKAVGPMLAVVNTQGHTESFLGNGSVVAGFERTDADGEKLLGGALGVTGQP